MRLLLAVVVALAVAAPASAATAPGVVTLPVDRTVSVPSVDASTPHVGVARPDGTVVLAGTDRGHGLLLLAVRRDGTPDPAFGVGGRSRVALPMAVTPAALLRDQDGRLLVVFTGPPASKYELPRLAVARLTEAGALDETFGDHGVAQTGVQAGCANCGPAALAADGGVLVAGATGQVSPEIEHDPNAPRSFTWVVRHITAAGTVDPAFGNGGTAAVAAGNALGHGIAVLDGGAIATVGTTGTAFAIARLTASGAPDPGFHGGTPLELGAAVGVATVVARPGGAADVLAPGSTTTQLLRVTAAGALDAGFGTGGAATLPLGFGSISLDLLARPDGSGVVFSAPFSDNSGARPALTATMISAAGAVTSSKIALPFGGGAAPSLTALQQSRYGPGPAVPRDDGSLLIPGDVSVVQYTGEGAGFEHEEAALASLTPALTRDPQFGGPARAARLALEVPRQSATRSRRGVRVRVTASGPGIVNVRVRAGGVTLARGAVPMLQAGAKTATIALTSDRRRRLTRGLRVTVTAQFTDLVGRQATARRTTTLL